MAAALLEAKRDLHTCPICFNITDAQMCDVCSDPSRDQEIICVVEEPGDVIAIERSGEYTGLYHVLHGVISPMNGVGPDKLYIKALLPRLRAAQEIILATGTTVEGEATALYLQRLLEPLGARVSRIAYGLPVGGALEYADEVTLGRALSGRQTRRVRAQRRPFNSNSPDSADFTCRRLAGRVLLSSLPSRDGCAARACT